MSFHFDALDNDLVAEGLFGIRDIDINCQGLPSELAMHVQPDTRELVFFYYLKLETSVSKCETNINHCSSRQEGGREEEALASKYCHTYPRATAEFFSQKWPISSFRRLSVKERTAASVAQ